MGNFRDFMSKLNLLKSDLLIFINCGGKFCFLERSTNCEDVSAGVDY